MFGFSSVCGVPTCVLPETLPAAGASSKLTPELRRRAEAMLRDTRGYPFVSDVIRGFPVGRTAFYRHFPKERIRELRG